ncbi:MAG: hypothetical protein EA401_02320 [Planctomycetota bacterium]|nr:MAG: hypothetical protein EA401_02320 [Planctomycetota bacterium]
MPVYRVREKMWGFGNNFTITDAEDRDCYYVDGKWLSFGKKLSFQDMSGNELLFIRQKLWSWRPRYVLERDGAVQAEVRKGFAWFGSRFTLDVAGAETYDISGSLFAHEFHIRCDGREVAHISKKVFAWTDSYGVDIVDDVDSALILATCVVVDQVLHDGKKKRG